MSVRVEVWGDYACFSRPEMKVERVSYDVITPSAARGILDAIYRHPGMRWLIDRIYVLNPIEFTNIRRNEVKSRVNARAARGVMTGGRAELYINTKEDRQQRATMLLRNVHYVIEAHFELVPERMNPGDNDGKFSDIMRRRLEKGQCFCQPCFGNREFPAHFQSWQGGDIITAYPDKTIELGLMLYDMDYSDPKNITPMFFRAVLENGVLDLGCAEVLR